MYDVPHASLCKAWLHVFTLYNVQCTLYMVNIEDIYSILYYSIYTKRMVTFEIHNNITYFRLS